MVEVRGTANGRGTSVARIAARAGATQALRGVLCRSGVIALPGNLVNEFASLVD